MRGFFSFVFEKDVHIFVHKIVQYVNDHIIRF
jgi:hypothetical protein